MNYEIASPPFNLLFRTKTNQELTEYRKWFFEVMPSRLAQLERAVCSDNCADGWQLDYSRSSIEKLGIWIFRHVETRPRSIDELDKIRGELKFDVDIADSELTNRTFSLALDAGMYFGETIKKQNAHLEWHQPRGSKKFVNDTDRIQR